MNTPQLTSDQFLATLKLAREGDSDALGTLFQVFYPRVESIVHRSLARDMGSKRPWLSARFSTGDIVQEVFRSVLKDLSAFTGTTESAFHAYLSRIVRNRIIDLIRFHESDRRDGRRADVDFKNSRIPSRAKGPATLAEVVEERRIYESILAGFPPVEQRLLRGRLESDLEFQTLASELGFNSVSTARRAFYTANSLLIIRLRQHYLEEAE